MSGWYLQPTFDSLATVVVIALVLIALLAIAPSFASTTERRRGLIALLRFGAISLLVLTMLRPTWLTTATRPQTATLVVMFDASQSMSIPDSSAGETRYDAVQKALRGVQAELASLGQNIEVAVYAFDSQAERLEFENGTIAFPDEATGRFTDIGSSLDDVVRQMAGKKLAGVVLLSDGAQRVFTPRVELQRAARDLARLDVPLHTLTFGQAIDPSQARDVAVKTLADQFTVFVKNEMVVQAAIHVQGLANRDVPVQLIVENEKGDATVVDTQRIRSTKDQETLDVSFRYVPQTPGQFKLSVAIEPQEGELITKNNRLDAYLNVLSGGLKVLYVEGRVVDRFEQKFLRRAIASSADMQIDFQWIDRRRRSNWPVDLTKQIEEGKYDVFIIGDLDSSALNDATLSLLAKQVEEGKGLMMQGGFHSFGAGRYQRTPLADVLPVTINRFEGQDFDAPIREDLHVSGPLSLRPAQPHYLTTIAVLTENDAAWRTLPPLRGANHFEGIKPRAQVLIETDSNAPILVAGEYGLGRVLAFAVDGTWRWSLVGKADLHKRFWRQCILWLAKKEELERRDVYVELPQRRFPPQSQFTFNAGARDAAGDVLADATFQASLVGPDGTKSSLRLSPSEEGVIGTVETGDAAGDYRIEVTALRDGKSLGVGTGRFFVADQDLELADPSAKPSQMASLAAITASAGGRAWAAEQLPELIEMVKESPPETEIEVQTKWTWPESARDAWLNLILLVSLLGGEWYLRKRWGMV
ncbi:MAG: glutamine amidotransferase [Blastopirellula sp. JB062]